MAERPDLKTLSDAAAKGPWQYRPYKFDDWGMIRGGAIDTDFIGTINPPVAVSSAVWGDRDYDQHRSAGTDPMRANGEFIVAVVNAYREGRLVEVRQDAED